MKKIPSLLFLLLFVFQSAVFASAALEVPESKFKKTERQAAGWVQGAGQSILDFTYLVMRKLDLAG